MRPAVAADDARDLGQRMDGPQVDGVEQRAFQQERAAVDQHGVVVVHLPVGQREVHEPVVGVVGRTVRRIGVHEVAPLVGRQRAVGDHQVVQHVVERWRVVQTRLPRMHDRDEAVAGHVAAARQILELGDELGTHMRSRNARAWGSCDACW